MCKQTLHAGISLYKRRSLQKTYLFQSTRIKTGTKFSHSPKFQPLKCRFSLWNLSSKKPKIQHNCCHFEQYSAAGPRSFHSVQDILSKWLSSSLLTNTLGYGCSRVILFWAKNAPNSKNESSKDREVDDCLKIHLTDLMKDTKSVASFYPSHQFWVGQNYVMA